MAVAPHSARPTDPGQAPNSSNGYYRRLPESALADRRLSRSALAVLAQLDGFARDKAECWPSVMTLAGVLGLCRRTIQLALTRLKSCGYITEKPASNPTGRVLVLLWKTGGAKPVTPGAQAPYSQGLPRAQIPCAQRKASLRKEGKRVAPLSSKPPNPSPSPQFAPSSPVPPRPRRPKSSATGSTLSAPTPPSPAPWRPDWPGS